VKYWIAYCFLLITGIAGRAQNLSLTHYNTPQGLADPVVYRAMQDSKGLLWFSTDNGISRFDGTRFKNFAAKDGLKASFIFSIIETNQQLLLSTFGRGLQFFDGVKALPTGYHSNLIKFPISITPFNNSLFIIDKNKEYYRISGNNARKFNYPVDKKKNYASKYAVHKNTLWCFHMGMHAYNAAADDFDKYITNSFIDSVIIYNAIALPQNGWLLCTGKGLVHLDEQLRANVLDATASQDRSNNMLLLSNGRILLQLPDGGLYCYEPDLRTRRLLLSGITINDMIEDRDGNIWLCTYGKGVIKISNTGILSFSLDDVVNPLLFFNEASRRLHVFSYQSGSFTLTETNNRYLLQKDAGKTNIAAGYNLPGNAPLYYGSNSIFSFVQNKPRIVAKATATIAHLSRDAAQQFWVGAKPGLYTGAALADIKPLAAFADKIVRCVVHTENGLHYIGTDDGLYLCRDTDFASPEKLPLPAGTPVSALCLQPGRNRLWIGTNNGLYSLEQNQLKKWISELAVYKILTDKNQHTWFATQRGLIGYNNRYFKLLDAENGFQPNIRDIAYDALTDQLYVLASDQLLLATAAGLIPAQPPAANQVYIIQQRAGDTILPATGTSFNLPAYTKSIALECVVPFFSGRQAYALYYRMNGSEWVNTNWSNSINAVNLRKGKNELELKLVDELNNTIGVQRKLTYHIPVPLWQQPWLIAAVSILLTLLLIFAIAKVRSLLQRKKQKLLREKKEKTELEHKVVSNMLNPHFMNNALNAIQSFVARNDQRNTLNYLSKFGRLMRINLELLEKNSIPLAKELQNLSLYLDFEQLRNPGLISYTVVVGGQTDVEGTMVPSLLLQPFVENAIWHGILPKGSPGHITISVQTVEQQLEIIIADDGIGRAASQAAKKQDKLEKPSRGLQIISDRLRLLNLDKTGHSFALYDNQPQGTCVRICIPL
jgi:hypothetical protein